MKLASLFGHSVELLGLILSDGRPADTIINFFFRARKYLGSHDRAWIAERVYHTLRHHRRLEWLADQLLKSGSLASVPESTRIWLAFLLGLLEESDDEDIANIATALAERPEVPESSLVIKESMTLFSNKSAWPWPVDSVARLAMEYSLPDWLMARLADLLGETDARAWSEACNQPAPVTLRANTLKGPREKVEAALAREGYPAQFTRISPFGLTLLKRANVFPTESFRNGFFELQDEASQIVSLCVDPKPGSRVLDACAGGGGKSLHLSALMKGRGQVFALDIYNNRLRDLRERAARANCQNIRILLVDKDSPPPPDLLNSMNYVLIDAPCTGLGVLRRNPDVRWKIQPASVQELAKTQRELIRRYADCLVSGGRLVYATCSVLREENEEVVESFLAERSDFKPGDARVPLSRYNLEHLAPEGGPYLRLWTHRHGTDSFFIAILEKS